MVPAWISPSYPLNFIFSNQNFLATAAAKVLATQPLGFVDVGARGGVHELVAPIAGVTSVLGFEPDEDACQELNREARSGTLPWRELKVLPVALAERPGPATLHLCSAPTNHSLLPVNLAFAERYRMEKFAQVGTYPLVTDTLDNVLFGPLVAESHWGEFIKLDTQGTEHEVLLGSKRTLAERTVALFVEVEFCQIYQNQKLFSELEVSLREAGFTFFGFHSSHERSRKFLDKRRHLGRERLLHADAVFFKDPLPGGHARVTLSSRQHAVLFVCALLLGYFDYALELEPEDVAARNLIQELAYHDPASALRAAVGLSELVQSRPELANIAVGRFVDARRAICNFEDVPVKLG